MSPGAVRHLDGLDAQRQEIQMAEFLICYLNLADASRPQSRLAQQAGAQPELQNIGNAF